MTEYIVEARYDGASLAIVPSFKEEIVRCRDCKRYMDYENKCEPNLGYCGQFDMHEVCGDCFCAWAERKVGA